MVDSTLDDARVCGVEVDEMFDVNLRQGSEFRLERFAEGRIGHRAKSILSIRPS